VDDRVQQVGLPNPDSHVHEQAGCRLRGRLIFFSFFPHHQISIALLAHARIEAPAKAYNPLFVYGESGLGKTHPAARDPATTPRTSRARRLPVCANVNSEEFTNDFINSIRDGQGQRLPTPLPRESTCC